MSLNDRKLKKFSGKDNLKDGIHVFVAKYCGYCHNLYPALLKVEDHAKKHGGSLTLYDGTQLEGKDHVALAKKNMTVQGFPTLYLVKDGKPIEQLMVRDAPSLIEKLKSLNAKGTKLTKGKGRDSTKRGKQRDETREQLKEQIMVALINHPRLPELLEIIFEQ